MNNNSKLKKEIEETFCIKCRDDCIYIYASSPEKLAEEIKNIMIPSGRVVLNQFLTSKSLYKGGFGTKVTELLRNFDDIIEEVKLGYIEIGREENPYDHIATYAFGILDSNSEIEQVNIFEDLLKDKSTLDIRVVKCKDVESLREEVINLIKVAVASISILKYTLYRKNETEAFNGEVAGSKLEKIISFVDNLSKENQNVLAVNIKIEQEDLRYSSVEDTNYLFFVV